MTTSSNQSTLQISGALVIDKPVGKSSRDTVKEVSQMLNIKRIGHIGSLHQNASGVLVLMIGPAVRLAQYLSEPSKKYQIVISLSHAGHVTEKMVTDNLTKEIGAHEVHAYSSNSFATKPKEVIITHLELLEFGQVQPGQSSFDIVVDMHCSAGSYLMKAVANLATNLKCDAFLAGTRRTKSGKFTLREAVTLKQLQEAVQKNKWSHLLRPAAEVIEQMPVVTFTDERVDLIKKGMLIAATEKEIQDYGAMTVYSRKLPENSADYIFRLVNEQEELIALICLQQGFAENANHIVWRPVKNFQSGG